MSLNPFSAVTDYASMLNKLGWIAFVEWGFAIAVLKDRAPAIVALVPFADYKVTLEDNTIPLGVVLPAAILALCFRALKVHDLISTLFRIRPRFDVEHILVPLASGAGIPVGTTERAMLAGRRLSLMDLVFYEYASSTKPQIDSHFVVHALDTWTWFWATVEAQLILLLVGSALAIAGDHRGALVVGALFLGLYALRYPLRVAVEGHARAQVQAILVDPSRKQAVESVLKNAL